MCEGCGPVPGDAVSSVFRCVTRAWQREGGELTLGGEQEVAADALPAHRRSLEAPVWATHPDRDHHLSAQTDE